MGVAGRPGVMGSDLMEWEDEIALGSCLCVR